MPVPVEPASLAALPLPGHSADEANERADEILSRPEFQEPAKSWFEQAGAWLQETVGRVLGELLGSGAASIVTWLVLAAGIAVIAFVGVRIARTTQRDPGVAVTRPGDDRRRSIDWSKEADRLEASGRWRDALRARYRAMVADLVERQVLRDIPGRTAGEHRAEITHRAPAVASEFAGASELFEEAWYGDAATGPDEVQRLRALSGAVARGARQ
jgi:hypothetical protein